jgi:hypothetical protein
MENRVWKPILDYEGFYEVSNDGLVRSIDRTVFNKPKHQWRKLKGVVLKQNLTKNGYPMIVLCSFGKSSTKRVHKLVATAFLGEPKEGLVVHHIDNDKLNNSVGNLEYVSMQKNTQEYYKTIGKANGSVPIEDIPKIIDRVKNGEKVYVIGSEYKVTRNDIAVLCKIIKLTGEELEIKQ